MVEGMCVITRRTFRWEELTITLNALIRLLRHHQRLRFLNISCRLEQKLDATSGTILRMSLFSTKGVQVVGGMVFDPAKHVLAQA